MDRRTGTSILSGGRMVLALITLAALSACGDSDDDDRYAIGGSTSGLSGTLVLQNNGADSLTVTTNGSFTFNNKVKKGSAYAVTVATQPAGQTCSVSGGSGTASATVTNVAVTCTANASYTVGGNVSGLGTGLSVVLRNNGGGDLTVNANGPFAFGTPIASGLPYAVTVFTQPTGQTCAVAQGSGTVNGADVSNVAVTCTTDPPLGQTYSIGGTVSGLTGGTLQLGLLHAGNMGFSIDVAANGSFNFNPDQVADGDGYQVSVQSQPAGQTCSVTNGNGTVAGANVTSVSVNCSATSADYSIGGTITGLTGDGLKIEDTSASALTVASGATTFTLPARRGNNYDYDVGIAAQPTGQTCVLLKSHGVVASANVANVDVRCIANVTDPIVGTYTVPALSASGTSYVYVTFYADGVYIYGAVENNGPNCGTTNGGNGVEYGVYNYNATTGAFTIKSAVVDTNGGCGVWDNGARYTGTLTKAGTGQSTVLTLTLPGGAGEFDLVPVESTAGQIVGSWGDAYHKTFVVFLPAGGNNVYSFFAHSQADSGATSLGQEAGIEYSCGSATALAGGTYTPDISVVCQAPAPSQNGPVDTNGSGGFWSSGMGVSSPGVSFPFTVNVDTLSAGDTWTRIKPN